MKIIFLALDVDMAVPRGDTVHTRELARFLSRRGIQIELVSATRGPEGSLGAGVREHALPPRSDWGTVRFCARLARSARVDAIYERRLSPKIGFAVSRLTGLPFLVEVNGTESEGRMQGRPTSPFQGLKRYLRSRLYRRAARVVAVTESLASEVRNRYGVERGRISVVPNGVDPNRFAPMVRSDALERLVLPPARWIVFVGNLVPWQGLEVALKAMPDVLRAHPTARLELVGDGMLRGRLERLTHDLGIADAVLMRGAVPHDEVALHIAAAEVCLAPFTRERNEAIGLSPLKIYEYMSCARPVVASDVPGVRELFHVSGAGLLVPADDPVSLARAIEDLLSNPEDARAMGSRGRAFVLAECTWERTAERVESVLRDVVMRSSPLP